MNKRATRDFSGAMQGIRGAHAQYGAPIAHEQTATPNSLQLTKNRYIDAQKYF